MRVEESAGILLPDAGRRAQAPASRRSDQRIRPGYLHPNEQGGDGDQREQQAGEAPGGKGEQHKTGPLRSSGRQGREENSPRPAESKLKTRTTEAAEACVLLPSLSLLSEPSGLQTENRGSPSRICNSSLGVSPLRHRLARYLTR